MATHIEVKAGPDAGRRFTLTGADVRIGRDPRSHVKLADPSLTGHLEVEFRHGAYHVINRLNYPIYLNEAILAPNEKRTWFHGHTLQPTADTQLVLLADEAERPSIGERGPVVETSQAGKKKSHVLELAVILICLPLAGVIFLWPSSDEPKSTATLAKPYNVLHKELTALIDAGSTDPKLRGSLLNLRTELADLRLHELRSQRAEATQTCRQAIAEVQARLEELRQLPQDRRPAEVTAVLEDVWNYLNERMKILVRRRT